MKILADFHHTSLYNSFHLLFEKRFGWELYRPIGEEWFSEGYWKIANPYNNSPGTIKQYLGLNQTFKPADGTAPLNQIDYIKDHIYYIKDLTNDIHHKAVTLDYFKENKFDLVLASYQPHYESFTILRNKYQKDAKVICQMGNNWSDAIVWKWVNNLMSSTSPLALPTGINTVFYKQEFDTDIFHYQPPEQQKNIYSFLNCIKETADYSTFNQLTQNAKNYQWRSYGSQCNDGCVTKASALANKIREASFVWQVKHTGDGYGHIIHNTLACGRPLLVIKRYYADQAADPLLVDGVTCIDIDKLSLVEIEAKLDYYSDPDRHKIMCENARYRFRENVNFADEAKKVEEFITKLT
jgi:hypothetical protein